MNTVFLPALGALIVLFVDALAGPPPRVAQATRASALSGIRLGVVAVASLGAVFVALAGRDASSAASPTFSLDAYSALGIGFVVAASFLVLALSLTHFGMARARAGEPIALLLFSISGLLAAIASENLLATALCLELAWLPTLALVAIDPRRLSSSESSLKVFFAHALASLCFLHGVAFLFFATGRFDLGLLSEGIGAAAGRPLFFELGSALVVIGLVARCAVAPFHSFAPDLHEGAPVFVTAHMGAAVATASFFVLLRVLHAILSGTGSGTSAGDSGALVAVAAATTATMSSSSTVAARLPDWIGLLGSLTLVWGHAMALVQVGLRRLVGWIAVGQVGFLTLALVDVAGDGGRALVFASMATSVAVIGVLTTLGSLSHHERACEHVGDLAGMASESPARATLLALFLLSLAGFPGTIGFVARRELLMSVAHAGHRVHLLVGVLATVLALTAVGRPLVALLNPAEGRRAVSRALTNEQVVLAICGAFVLYLGTAPLFGEHGLSGRLDGWIEAAVASLAR